VFYSVVVVTIFVVAVSMTMRLFLIVSVGEPLFVELAESDLAFIRVERLVTHKPPREVDKFAMLLVASINEGLLVNLTHQVKAVKLTQSNVCLSVILEE
jgi:hypothetical protein